MKKIGWWSLAVILLMTVSGCPKPSTHVGILVELFDVNNQLMETGEVTGVFNSIISLGGPVKFTFSSERSIKLLSARAEYLLTHPNFRDPVVINLITGDAKRKTKDISLKGLSDEEALGLVLFMAIGLGVAHQDNHKSFEVPVPFGPIVRSVAVMVRYEDDQGKVIESFFPISRLASTQEIDTDGDGLSDYWEDYYPCLGSGWAFGSYGPDGDPDNDGLTNYEEFLRGLDPCDRDSDGDGIADGEEVDNNTDPLDPLDPPVTPEPEPLIVGILKPLDGEMPELPTGGFLDFDLRGEIKGGEAPFSVKWKVFRDGIPVTVENDDILSAASFQTTEPGTFAISLEVKDDALQVVADFVTIEVTEQPLSPSILIQSPVTGSQFLVGEEFLLSVRVENASAGYGIRWVLPWGGEVSGNNLMVSSSAPGASGNLTASLLSAEGIILDQHTVEIQITDPGSEGEGEGEGEVNHAPTLSDFVGLRQLELGLDNMVSGEWQITATDDDNDPLGFLITIGGWEVEEPPDDSGVFVVRRIFTSAGEFTVVFTVNDGRGGVTSRSLTVTVATSPDPPRIFVTSPANNSQFLVDEEFLLLARIENAPKVFEVVWQVPWEFKSTGSFELKTLSDGSVAKLLSGNDLTVFSPVPGAEYIWVFLRDEAGVSLSQDRVWVQIESPASTVSIE